ncbi:MAG: hypothetical protein ABI239_11805 [Aquihabitans sp.]
MDHTAACALEYWNGQNPWGSDEVLDRLATSSVNDDRTAAAAISALMVVGEKWLEDSTPVDWTAPKIRLDFRCRVCDQVSWCDDLVFARIWTYVSWLGWHEGY